MSTALSSRQEQVLAGAVAAQYSALVAPVWVVVRLVVVVDARPDGLLYEVASRAAADLGVEVGGAALRLPQGSTHSRERAPFVLDDLRRARGMGRDVHGRLLVLRDPDALEAAAAHLAAHPHSALVVAVATCRGHALAARWS